jgi:hypothetical protein
MMCLIFLPFSNFVLFFRFPILMIFNFHIIKKVKFQKLFATHHKSARLTYSVALSISTRRLLLHGIQNSPTMDPT